MNGFIRLSVKIEIRSLSRRSKDKKESTNIDREIIKIHDFQTNNINKSMRANEF